MSCAIGTLIRTGRNTFTRVEDLFEGAETLSARGEPPNRVIHPLFFAMEPCVRIKTNGGGELVCTRNQVLEVPGGSSVLAEESLGRTVLGYEGGADVIEVSDAGSQRVIRLRLRPACVYEAGGILCQEE